MIQNILTVPEIEDTSSIKLITFSASKRLLLTQDRCVQGKLPESTKVLCEAGSGSSNDRETVLGMDKTEFFPSDDQAIAYLPTIKTECHEEQLELFPELLYEKFNGLNRTAGHKKSKHHRRSGLGSSCLSENRGSEI